MNNQKQVAKLSSNANDGANDSYYYLNLNNSAANRNQNISTHLSLYITKIMATLPLGKTQSNVSSVLVGLISEPRRFRDITRTIQ